MTVHRALKEKLLLVTQENTQLLKEIAREKERHMKLSQEIKGESMNEKTASNSSRTVNAVEEKTNLSRIALRQEQEIEQLKLEIQSMRTKRGNYYQYTMTDLSNSLSALTLTFFLC